MTRWTPARLTVVAACLACTSAPTQPGPGPLGDADVTVLFVGNSLTYANDLPSLVGTVAEAAGHTFASASVALPDFSLEDHWRTDIASVVRNVRPQVVVLQQGPSSLPESQVHLRRWADTLSPVIEEVGARPALLMVWPDRSRTAFFDDVRTAYRDAAISVDGMFIPAGEAWREAWESDPDLALYGPDGFHPSLVGSQVAALTVFAVLFGEEVGSLPALLEPTSPALPVIDLGDAAQDILAAVDAAVQAWALR